MAKIPLPFMRSWIKKLKIKKKMYRVISAFAAQTFRSC